MEPSVLSKTPADELLSGISCGRYDQFLAKVCAASNRHYAVLTLPFECDDPLRWFHHTKEAFSFRYYSENPSQGRAIAALGQAKELVAEGPKRFEKIGRSLQQMKEQIHHLSAVKDVNNVPFLGGFSFFDQPAGGLPAASFTLPAFTVQIKKNVCSLSMALKVGREMQKNELRNKIEHQLNKLSPKPDVPEMPFKNTEQADRPRPKVQEANSYKHWHSLIDQAQELMSNKRLKKVVLARQLTVEAAGSFSATLSLHRLRTAYPRCQSFLIKRKKKTFLGSTPELLMEVCNDQLRTEALAGSIARGQHKKEDEQRAKNLRMSVKNNEEHQYVVDHVEKLCRPFTCRLSYPDRPEIKKLANVQHLYTPITATLKTDARPLELLAKLHPTPAVGGTPRDKALTFIKEHEDFDRGWFAGPFGWITPDQDCHFSVAIRSGLIGERRARLFAGCGIVAGSDPKKEWDETKLKFKPMLSALHHE